MNEAYNIWAEYSNTSVDYATYFNKLLEKIKNKETFSLIRISDGEYHIFTFGVSVDGKVDVETCKKVAIELNKLISLKRLENPESLLIATQYNTMYDGPYNVFIKTLEFLKKEGYNTSLFSWATVLNKMPAFFNALNESGKPIIIVGPEYLSRLKCFKITSIIPTNQNKCWEQQVQIEARIEAEIQRHESPIILYCCAVTAKLAIAKNYHKYGNKITQIDVGANLNPYVGVFIRCWQRPAYERYLKEGGR